MAPKQVNPVTVNLIDISRYPPKFAVAIEMPGNVVGPPTAAWLAKDESWVIVTSATKANARAEGVSCCAGTVTR